MPDCFSESKVTDFLNLMKLPDGTSIVSDDMVDYLRTYGFFVAPASTKYHGNYEGGLIEHSIAVTKFLVQLTKDNHLTWKNPRSPYVVGMFHDLCKIDQYIPQYELREELKPAPLNNPKSTTFVKTLCGYEYNSDTLLKGHGDKSVMFLSQFYTLTDEEIMCIRYHMGAFTDKSEWNYYTRAVRNYPNVLWTHQADMLASHVVGV